MKLGVIGLGSVGNAVLHGLSYYFGTVKGFDINGTGNFKDVLKSDIIFICVSTGKNDTLSTENVEEVIDNLDRNNYSGIVVIKSTVSFGFTDEMEKKHQNLRLVYAPEFLREEQAYQFFIFPDRIVLSGDEKDVSLVEDVFFWSNCPVFKMKHKEAELMKLAHNAKIAVDVSFTNEIKMFSDKLGLDACLIMKSIWIDRRRTKYWLNPLKGPYGGKCVEKDTNDYIKATNSKIVHAANDINLLYRKQKNQ